MTAEDRARMLNEIEDIVEKYGFDVAGYDDGVDGDDDMFEVLLLKK